MEWPVWTASVGSDPASPMPRFEKPSPRHEFEFSAFCVAFCLSSDAAGRGQKTSADR
jgi:hypothetical protein